MRRSMRYLLLSIMFVLLAACEPEVTDSEPAGMEPTPMEIETEEAEAEQAVVTGTAAAAETALPQATRTPLPALPLTVEALAGSWLGALYLDEKPVTLSMVVTVAEGTATVRPRTLGFSGSVNGSDGMLVVDDSENSFTFDSEIGHDEVHHFTGQLRKTGIDGEVTAGDKAGNFYLIPLAQLEGLTDYTGLYRFEDGRTIDISLSPTGFGSPGTFLPGLWLVNYATGAYRALSAVSETTFFMGPSLGIALPATDIVTFQRNEGGVVESLMVQSLEVEKGVETAVRENFPTEDVTFESEGVTLAGTVTRPTERSGEGPYPAIVLVHGSGRATRDQLERFSWLFAGEGFAVLAYDKRGVGESGGVYSDTASESRLLLLASDAAAGVGYMRERPDVNPDKVGLLGGSQAGWIIPAAAVQSGEVAFMVNLSGPVVTVGQEGVYSAFTGDGDIQPVRTEAEIATAVEGAAGRGFDPLPYISELDIPGLWLFGAKDMSVPVAQSAENLQQIIDEEGKSNYTYTVFPNGNHGLWESETGGQADWPYIREIVPGYFDILKDWLRSQVLVES